MSIASEIKEAYQTSDSQDISRAKIDGNTVTPLYFAYGTYNYNPEKSNAIHIYAQLICIRKKPLAAAEKLWPELLKKEIPDTVGRIHSCSVNKEKDEYYSHFHAEISATLIPADGVTLQDLGIKMIGIQNRIEQGDFGQDPTRDEQIAKSIKGFLQHLRR